MAGKPQKKEFKQPQLVKAQIVKGRTFSGEASPAVVEEIIGRTGNKAKLPKLDAGFWKEEIRARL